MQVQPSDQAIVSLRETLVDPETDLVLRVQGGDLEAVAEIYDAHRVSVRMFAQRFLYDRAAAEDLVHEVFAALPDLIERFRGDSSLRQFLLSVAINKARHHVRAVARRRAAWQRLALEPVPSPPDPEQRARQSELADQLARALDALPLDQRVAFVLCEVEGRTSREAAAIVDVSEPTIRTRLFYAKRKLRARLERRGGT